MHQFSHITIGARVSGGHRRIRAGEGGTLDWQASVQYSIIMNHMGGGGLTDTPPYPSSLNKGMTGQQGTGDTDPYTVPIPANVLLAHPQI